mmetsp:Transcript_20886/g.34979  ORF Transcript_20886/g.34979 Transcript_20886/m.34979 type:complete len:347 (-) Transcript_20886:1240-2280(-)
MRLSLLHFLYNHFYFTAAFLPWLSFLAGDAGTGTCSCDKCSTATLNCTAAKIYCEADGGIIDSCNENSTTSFSCQKYSCDTTDGGFDCSKICYAAKCDWDRSCTPNDQLNVPVCFHEDTQIAYQGKSYSQQDFLDGLEPECVVPHTPRDVSNGIIITYSCSGIGSQDKKNEAMRQILRLTDTHLVAVTRAASIPTSTVTTKIARDHETNDHLAGGRQNQPVTAQVRGIKQYIPANRLQVGDLVHIDTSLDTSTNTPSAIKNIISLCPVRKIEKESTPQNYFGLNCRHSEVVANGVMVSTFAVNHDIPAWYMYWTTPLLGVATASTWGDAIVQQLFRWGVLKLLRLQ